MVLKFSAIPPHLQNKLCQKIDFLDLKEVECSSRTANQIVNLVSIKPTFRVKKLAIESESIWFRFKSPKTGKRVARKWDDIINLSLPRFSVKKVYVASTVNVDLLNHLSEKVTFTNDTSILVWNKQGENAVAVFKRLIQIFNISAFEIDRFYDDTFDADPQLVYLPEFHKLESVFEPATPMPDEMFLKLEAHTIYLDKLVSEPNVFPTLNTFFKQWLQKERRIAMFAVHIGCEEREKCAEQILSGLPHFFIWSCEQHENSIFSDISREALYGWRTDEMIYMVERDDKKLLILFADENLGAMEVDDAKEFLKKYLFKPNADEDEENNAAESNDSDF